MGGSCVETATGVRAGMMPTSESRLLSVFTLEPPPPLLPPPTIADDDVVDEEVLVAEATWARVPDIVVVVNVSHPSESGCGVEEKWRP